MDQSGAEVQAGGSEKKRTVIGNYEILHKVGQGGMGAVFLARQISMNRQIALKILPPKLAKDQKFVARFLREAQSAGQCNHQNLINVHDAGQAGGYYFYSMEYVDGPTLKEWFKEHGPMGETVAYQFMKEVAQALHEAHRCGLVHRDVKPDNILVTPDGYAKLGDLGLAKPMSGEADVTLGGVAIGTPAYMSPEQSKGEAVDGRSDLYSLGATFYHLLSGRPVFDGKTVAAVSIKHAIEPPKPIRQRREDLTPETEALLMKLLAKEPEKRYADAQALIQDLDALLAGEVPSGLRRRLGRQRGAASGGGHAAGDDSGTRQAAGQPLALYIGIGVAAVVLVGVAIAFLAGPSDQVTRHEDRAGQQQQQQQTAQQGPDSSFSTNTQDKPADPNPAAADKEQAAREMLGFAQKFAGEHPDDYTAIKDYLQKAKRAGTGTVVELEADKALRELQESWDKRRQQSWDGIVAAVTKHRQAEAFDAALAVLEQTDGDLQEYFREERSRLLTEIKGLGQAKLDAALTAAQAALRGGKHAEAEAALKQWDQVSYSRGRKRQQERVAGLRKGIEAGRQAAKDAVVNRQLAERQAIAEACIAALLHNNIDEARSQLRKQQRAAIAQPAAKDMVERALAVLSSVDARQEAMMEGAKTFKDKELQIETAKGPVSGPLSRVEDRGIMIMRSVGANGQMGFWIAWKDLPQAQQRQFLGDWRPDADVKRLADAVDAMRQQRYQRAQVIVGDKDDALSQALASLAKVEELGQQETKLREQFERIEQVASKGVKTKQAETLLTQLRSWQADAKDSAYGKQMSERAADLAAQLKSLAEAGQTLLANGGFERELGGSDWQVSSVIEPKLVKDGAAQGRSYLAVEHTMPGRGALLQKFKVPVGKWLYLRGRYRLGNGSSLNLGCFEDGALLGSAKGVAPRWRRRGKRGDQAEGEGKPAKFIDADEPWMPIAVAFKPQKGEVDLEIRFQGRRRTPIAVHLDGFHVSILDSGPLPEATTIDGRRFAVLPINANRTFAATLCEELGGRLALIPNEGVNKSLNAYMNKFYSGQSSWRIWTGMEATAKGVSGAGKRIAFSAFENNEAEEVYGPIAISKQTKRNAEEHIFWQSVDDDRGLAVLCEWP